MTDEMTHGFRSWFWVLLPPGTTAALFHKNDRKAAAAINAAIGG